MAEQFSFVRELKQNLSSNPTVTAVAGVLAVVALGVIEFGNVIDGGVYLIVNIGVCIPYIYEAQWSKEYTTPLVVAWTVSAAGLTAGIYVGVHSVLVQYVTSSLVSLDAFVATLVAQYALGAVYSSISGGKSS